MNLNSIVIVNLHSPRERFFGRLLDVATYGITVRGIDLNAFEDWMAHITRREESGVQPNTVFFPMKRKESREVLFSLLSDSSHRKNYFG